MTTSYTTIKVTSVTRDRIRAIGSQAHRSAEEVVTAALDSWEDQAYWQAYSHAHSQLTSAEHADDSADTAAWDAISGDGIESD